MVPALPLLPGRRPLAKDQAQLSAADAQEIVVVHPIGLEDGRQAIQAVRAGRSVVLNASDLDPELGQRLVDFTCGGIAAMDGQSHRLGEAVFLFAPMLAKIAADPAPL